MRDENTDLRDRVRGLEQDHSVLRARVQELVEESRKLHETIGELRWRLQQWVDENALEIMRRVPEMVAEIWQVVEGDEASVQELRPRLESLVTVVQAIPKLVRGEGEG